MKRSYTSKVFQAIAYLWVFFPITFTFYAIFVLGIPGAGVFKLILSPWYWFVCFVSVSAGLGVLRVQWYGWYAFLFSNFVMLYQTAVVLAYYSEAKVKFASFVATVVLQIMALYLVGREIRVPYFLPRIRWWESDPRYKLSLPVKLLKLDGTEYEGEIMDISRNGCFVKTYFFFPPEEKITLDFALFERPIKCHGRVIWQTESTVTHPKGVGIKFENLDRQTVTYLKQATEKLRKLARVYTQITRERNWQEYLQREQRYQGKDKK